MYVASRLAAGFLRRRLGRFLAMAPRSVAWEPNRVEFLSRMGDMATLLNDEEYFSATQVVRNLCVASEDRLTTKEEYEAATKTLVRIEEEKVLECFRAVSPKRAPTTESAQ